MRSLMVPRLKLAPEAAHSMPRPPANLQPWPIEVSSVMPQNGGQSNRGTRLILILNFNLVCHCEFVIKVAHGF